MKSRCKAGAVLKVGDANRAAIAKVSKPHLNLPAVANSVTTGDDEMVAALLKKWESPMANSIDENAPKSAG